jgi:hypothetical protein
LRTGPRDHLTRRAVDRINELDPYNETLLERGRDLLHSHGREQEAEEWEERLRRLEGQ